MSFVPFKQWAEQDTESYIIGKNQTLSIGDPVIFGTTVTAGYVQTANQTSSFVYGVVVGFKASPGGLSQSNLTASSVAASAVNQTTDMYRAVILPARQARLFIADLSQTSGTTSGSADPGNFALKFAGNTLDETTWTVNTSAKLAFFSIGSGLATSANGPTGLFPITGTQVIGFFTSTNTA